MVLFCKTSGPTPIFGNQLFTSQDLSQIQVIFCVFWNVHEFKLMKYLGSLMSLEVCKKLS